MKFYARKVRHEKGPGHTVVQLSSDGVHDNIVPSNGRVPEGCAARKELIFEEGNEDAVGERYLTKEEGKALNAAIDILADAKIRNNPLYEDFNAGEWHELI